MVLARNDISHIIFGGRKEERPSLPFNWGEGVKSSTYRSCSVKPRDGCGPGQHLSSVSNKESRRRRMDLKHVP